MFSSSTQKWIARIQNVILFMGIAYSVFYSLWLFSTKTVLIWVTNQGESVFQPLFHTLLATISSNTVTLMWPLCLQTRWLEVKFVIFDLRVAVFWPSSRFGTDLDPLFFLPLVWMDVNKLKTKRNSLRALCVKWPESNFHHMLSSGREVGLGASSHSSSLFPGAGPWLAVCQGTDW